MKTTKNVDKKFWTKLEKYGIKELVRFFTNSFFKIQMLGFLSKNSQKNKKIGHIAKKKIKCYNLGGEPFCQ